MNLEKLSKEELEELQAQIKSRLQQIESKSEDKNEKSEQELREIMKTLITKENVIFDNDEWSIKRNEVEEDIVTSEVEGSLKSELFTLLYELKFETDADSECFITEDDLEYIDLISENRDIKLIYEKIFNENLNDFLSYLSDVGIDCYDIPYNRIEEMIQEEITPTHTTRDT